MTTATKHKPAPGTRTRRELWQDTIDASLNDRRWHEYDCDIKRIVAEFNRHLSGEHGYLPLDWRVIKAIVWTESGGPAKGAWRGNPMQIGNSGDPGLGALLSGREGGELIMPADLKSRLSVTSAHSSPQMNIRAGTAYLLMRLARYDVGTVLDDHDRKEYMLVVKAGDSLDKIARAHGTTIDTLRRCNPGVAVLHAGQTLTYQKAAIRKRIVGWDMATTARIASGYNVGDPGYAQKLDYCLAVMRRDKQMDTACAP